MIGSRTRNQESRIKNQELQILFTGVAAGEPAAMQVSAAVALRRRGRGRRRWTPRAHRPGARAVTRDGTSDAPTYEAARTCRSARRDRRQTAPPREPPSRRLQV